MKVTFKSITFGLIFSIGMLSCASEAKPKNDEKDEKKVLTVESASKDFCECKDSEDVNKCYDEWVEKYGDGNFISTSKDSEKLATSMLDCDLNGTIYVGNKFE